ncbi:MAG: mercury resistance system transport protein MerF [Candidatus Rokuibacteriota bacterium]
MVSTAVTAICCATPVLGAVLAAVGLAAWLGWADYVLIPALLLFAGMTAYAIVRKRRQARELRDQDGR